MMFAGLRPEDLQSEYIAGLIILRLAPCKTMILVMNIPCQWKNQLCPYLSVCKRFNHIDFIRSTWSCCIDTIHNDTEKMHQLARKQND